MEADRDAEVICGPVPQNTEQVREESILYPETGQKLLSFKDLGMFMKHEKLSICI